MPETVRGRPVVVEGDLDVAQAIVVLLHGRDRDHDDLRKALVEPCARPGLVFLCPLARDQTWYPTSFLAPEEDNQPFLDHALERVGQVVDEAIARCGRERVVLAGFSQGACLACEWAYRDGRALGGLVAFTGGLIGPPGTSWAPKHSLAGLRVFLGGSEEDTWVPAGRVRATAEVFEKSGAVVDLLIYPGDDHKVSDEERTAFDEMIAEVMA